MANGLLEGLEDQDPTEALTALCLAAGILTARIEAQVGGDILSETLRLVAEAKRSVE
jgi:hypothetical protein